MRRWGQKIIAWIILITFSCSPVPVPAVIDLPAESLDFLLKQQEAEKHSVPPELLSALIESESSFDPEAVNKLNKDGTIDIGIAQLNSAYLDYYSQKFLGGETFDPFDPVQSILVAEKYLEYLYRQTGCWEKAVIAYKAGLSRVDNPPRHIKEIARRIVNLVRGETKKTSL